MDKDPIDPHSLPRTLPNPTRTSHAAASPSLPTRRPCLHLRRSPIQRRRRRHPRPRACSPRSRGSSPPRSLRRSHRVQAAASTRGPPPARLELLPTKHRQRRSPPPSTHASTLAPQLHGQVKSAGGSPPRGPSDLMRSMYSGQRRWRSRQTSSA
ncbi:hypothetical protein ACQJBY_017788 [Aegilops geniculata]